MRFDEGMNDLLIDHIPPNVQHLQRIANGDPIPAETDEVPASEFQFLIHPFASFSPRHSSELVGSDDLSNRVYIKSIVSKKSASKLFSSLSTTRNKIQGACIVEIDGDRIFTKDNAVA